MPNMYIDIITSDLQIQDMMNIAIKEEIDKRLNQQLFDTIITKIKKQIYDFLLSSDESRSLVSGLLAVHFGLPKGYGDAAVNEIATKIGESINWKVSGNDITFSIGNSDFLDLLSLPSATITTEKGTALPWLDWLLIQGDKVIISKFSIKVASGYGRSGGAIMIENSGGFWKVPTEYAGVVNDNWITKTINNQAKAISDIIEQEIARKF